MLPGVAVDCPYCGEPIEFVIDDSVEHQEYVEDCAVCCRPIDVEVTIRGASEIEVNCRTDNEA